MDDMFRRLEDKLDKLDDKLDSLDKNMVVNNMILKEHMRRTELNEIRIEKLEDHIRPLDFYVKSIQSFPDKIKNGIYFVSKVLTIITALSALGWFFTKK